MSATNRVQCTIGAGTVFGQVVAGATTKRIGKQRWQLIVCECLVTAFIGSLAAVNSSRRNLAIAGTFIGSFFVGCKWFSRYIYCINCPVVGANQ